VGIQELEAKPFVEFSVVRSSLEPKNGFSGASKRLIARRVGSLAVRVEPIETFVLARLGTDLACFPRLNVVTD
jgi:hypothetical protein